MKRRKLLLPLAIGPLLTGCLWPRLFDFGWDEEVRLHNGQVLIVKVTYTFERLGGIASFGRYQPSILRDTQIAFDAGGADGWVTQLFKGFHPLLLDESGGRWYVVLTGGHYGNSWHEPGQDWGPAQNFSGQRVAQLVEKTFRPISIADLPAEFAMPNVLPLYAPVPELANLDGKQLTLAQKALYLERYPLGPGDMRFERPHVNSNERTGGCI
jgi:hypothetical protein